MPSDHASGYSPGQWREQFEAASAGLDLRRSRELVHAAADAGASLSELYVGTVRPALVAVRGRGLPARHERLLIESTSAVLTEVGARGMDGRTAGAGREALVSIGTGPIDRLDGQVIVDVLCAAGWEVQEMEAAAPSGDIATLARERAVELVVMPTSNPADLLLAASTYTALRRLPDPPVIVACSLGHPDETRRARAAGADTFVSNPDALVHFVTGRLPSAGSRNWGVQLRRHGTTLVVAPTGDLDAASIGRLRKVVDSRRGSFSSFVVDTRHIASAPDRGTEALLDWMREGRTGRFVPGAALGAQLAADAHLLALPADAGG